MTPTAPRDVAVVGFAHARHTESTFGTTNGVEMLAPVFAECYRQTGLDRTDIEFWCSGSSDYLAGRAFSFISAVDTIGAFPPICESHVEMDAAWAFFEAYLKIATGQADTALVYGFGKASASTDLDSALALQLDPYTVAPLWPGRHHMAALQARAGIDAGRWSEGEMASVAARATGRDERELLAEPYVADPLRRHDCPPVTDGAGAIILASGDRARDLVDTPAYVTGIEHIADSAEFGARDLTDSPSARAAAVRATRSSGERPDLGGVTVAELHTQYTHQELLLRAALGIGDHVAVTPSGGSLLADPLFSAGLERIGYAANDVMEGRTERALAHATSGHLLQQNLICLLEGRPA
ncbi:MULTISPECIES: thiolase domain-containing protein [Dietzia]|uniref:Lipid-transfer protein n=1 Tax=Dietzia psychralcaliphila TaxID=139021 RepID=A0AAD0NMS2_9ACTN|nr:thiolase domain-containing protein [Dietzia psychralcaliphila]AWH94691.1 lipid-transfer protein [Dietzia psychralcaliphila]PTM86375.1 acetyl-CoA acetyltransferase [Dietzia psychralcaliphila]